MIALYITIPIMALAVFIAAGPVLIGSVRHHRSLQRGELDTQATAQQEAEFWHHTLGHRRAVLFAPTPQLVTEAEAERVGARSETYDPATGKSLWKPTPGPQHTRGARRIAVTAAL